MITTFEQYAAGALESESVEQRGWRSEIPTKLYRINHALTGLITELAEMIEVISTPTDTGIDLVHLKEELGDAWWYFALLALAHNDIHSADETDKLGHVWAQHDYGAWGSNQAFIDTMESILLNLLRCVGESCDVVKRRIYYFADELPDGHEKKTKALWSKMDIERIGALLSVMTTAAGFELSDVWTTNLLKLIGPNGRYAGKFDADKALFRDLVSERKVLEGGEELSQTPTHAETVLCNNITIKDAAKFGRDEFGGDLAQEEEITDAR